MQLEHKQKLCKHKTFDVQIGESFKKKVLKREICLAPKEKFK